MTAIVRRPGAKVLWSIKGWHRWLFISDDAESAAIGYGGLNLVPQESNLQLEVLHFYNKGKMVRSVKLADLYSDPAQLTRSVSHLAWVDSIYVNRSNQLVLKLVTGKRVAFAMSSGQAQAQILEASK